MRSISSRYILLIVSSLFFINTYAALPTSPWYAIVDAGVFQGNFDLTYNDLSDSIPQNVRQPVQQNGYTGGIGIGYNRLYGDQYLLGGEINVNLNTYHANFASGASSLAFNDNLAVPVNVDLTFLPGIFINEITAVYAKAGLSYAYVTSNLSSPSGFTDAYNTHSGTSNVFGVALGLGVKRWIGTNVSVFTEYLYHDYQKINFSNFQNFSATYSHTVRVNTQSIVVGLNYYI